MEIEITTDYEKAVEVSRNAIGMLEKKVYPFNLPDIFPDARVPKGIKPGSKDHAIYLFFMVSIDRGRQSNTLYRKGRAMREQLDFSTIHDLDRSYIQWFLEQNFEKPKDPKRTFGDPVKTWIENAKKLEEQVQGDPRKLKAETVEQTLKNIQKFRGYGKEIPWLLIKNYIKAGIWDFPLDQLNIKIDRHVIRISYGTSVITLNPQPSEIRYDVLTPHLSRVYSKVIQQEKISPIDLNDAFWAIGQYRCGEDNAVHCELDCPMKCKIKVRTEKEFTILHLEEDTRKDTDNLFSKKIK